MQARVREQRPQRGIFTMKNLTRYPVALTRRSQTTGKSLVKRSCYVEKATHHYRLRFTFSFPPSLDDVRKSEFVDEIILDMDGICSFVSLPCALVAIRFLFDFSFSPYEKEYNRFGGTHGSLKVSTKTSSKRSGLSIFCAFVS